MTSNTRISRRTAAAAIGGFGLVQPAWSQAQWPDRPVRIVVPFAAGGPVDFFGRLIAQKLQQRIGTPFIVENKPGGGATVAAQAVAAAPADGYTLLMTNSASNSTAPWVVKNVRYDPVADFAHIAIVSVLNVVLVASAKSQFRSVADVVREAKAKGEIIIANAALGSLAHLMAERFAKAAGIKLVPVAYRGGGPAQAALIGGEVSLMFDSVPLQMPHIRAGTLRALAVTDTQRAPYLPDTPTFKELGYDITGSAWIGLAGPKDLPPAVVTRLSRQVRQILKLPDVRKRYDDAYAAAPDTTPEQATSYVRGDVRVWREVIQTGNFKTE